MKTYWDDFLERYPWMSKCELRFVLRLFWYYCDRDSKEYFEKELEVLRSQQQGTCEDCGGDLVEFTTCISCMRNAQMWVILVDDHSGDKGSCYRYSTLAVNENDAINKSMNVKELNKIDRKYFRAFIPSDPSSYRNGELVYFEGDCRL